MVRSNSYNIHTQHSSTKNCYDLNINKISLHILDQRESRKLLLEKSHIKVETSLSVA